MTQAELRAHLERLHLDVATLVGCAHRERYAGECCGALDALERARDELSAALDRLTGPRAPALFESAIGRVRGGVYDAESGEQ